MAIRRTPSCASLTAMARPMPPEAPVTSALSNAMRMSERVLPAPQSLEACVAAGDLRAGTGANRLHDAGLEQPQERVGRLLHCDGGGHRRHAALALARLDDAAGLQRFVVGLDRGGKAQIRHRVFVAAVDLRLRGQRSELVER